MCGCVVWVRRYVCVGVWCGCVGMCVCVGGGVFSM